MTLEGHIEAGENPAPGGRALDLWLFSPQWTMALEGHTQADENICVRPVRCRTAQADISAPNIRSAAQARGFSPPVASVIDFKSSISVAQYRRTANNGALLCQGLKPRRWIVAEKLIEPSDIRWPFGLISE
jgi:hypothetical protein